ncbi:MAG: SRPBCC domain-containing protein [Caldilineaceae bacterium]
MTATNNTSTLLVEAQIQISASPSRVWQVLTTPRYIRQWDDLPEDFGEEPLTLGSTIAWKGHATLTITEFEPAQRLRMTLYGASWEQMPSAYDIAYTFTLAAQDEGTLLTITVGDFASLPNGQEYYDASVEFASEAGQKIQQLAVASDE